MRAKFVNEVQNFERGKSPRSAMGIGGVDLKKEFEEKLNDLQQQISGNKANADEDWEEFLRKTFVGKKITSYMRKLISIDTKTGKTKPWKSEKEDYTIVVQDIKPGDELSNAVDRPQFYSGNLIVADMENNMYEISLNQKVYIEE